MRVQICMRKAFRLYGQSCDAVRAAQPINSPIEKSDNVATKKVRDETYRARQ